MDKLPQEIQELLRGIEGEHEIYYKDKLDFCEKAYARFSTYEEVWAGIKRSQAFLISIHAPRFINKKLLGPKKYEAIQDLIDSARETL